MNARLPIISQDCQSCPLRTKCWNTSKNPSNEVLVINLLVCRLKLGIKREASTRLLLQMLQPKVNNIAAFIQSRCDVDDFETLSLEVQSAIIEYLLTDYKLGERAWPLHYLFARPKGVMTGWTMRYIERRRNEQRMVNVAFTPDVDFEHTVAALNSTVTNGRVQGSVPELIVEDPETPPATTPILRALDLVDDGLTLSAREYRIFRFCLSHAGDARRGENGTPVSGLHMHLAQQMGWDRSRVSRVFRQASAKIVDVTGYTERVLGVDVPVDPRQRRNRMLGLDHDALSAEEGRALVQLAAKIGDAAACRAFGVHSKTVYFLRKRYGEEANTRRANSTDHELYGISA